MLGWDFKPEPLYNPVQHNLDTSAMPNPETWSTPHPNNSEHFRGDFTNSIGGMTVILSDLHLTQKHADVTSSHSKSLSTAVPAWMAPIDQENTELTSSHDVKCLVFTAYQQQCRRDGLLVWPPVYWLDLQPWLVLSAYQQQCRRDGHPEWPPVDPAACRDDRQP